MKKLTKTQIKGIRELANLSSEDSEIRKINFEKMKAIISGEEVKTPSEKEIALSLLEAEIKASIIKYLKSTNQSHGRIISHVEGESRETKIDLDSKRYLKFAVAVTIDV